MKPFWRENLGLKLTALALATMTWLFVNNIISELRVIDNVPLHIRARPGYTVHQNVSLVDVTVRGSRDDLRQLSRQDLVVELDLTREEAPAVIKRALRPDIVRVSRRIRVDSVSPSEVIVRLERPPSAPSD